MSSKNKAKDLAALARMAAKANAAKAAADEKAAAEKAAADAAAAEAAKEKDAPAVDAPAVPVRALVTGDVPAHKSLKIEKDRPMQNGVKRPSIGGLCRAVWDALDKVYAAGQGELPTSAHAKQLAIANGWNQNNASIELCQWRKFNGLQRARKAVTAEA